MHGPTPRINDIVRERRGVSADTALRLARYFDTTPQVRLNLQASHDLRQARILAGEKIQREVAVVNRSAWALTRTPYPFPFPFFDFLLRSCELSHLA